MDEGEEEEEIEKAVEEKPEKPTEKLKTTIIPDKPLTKEMAAMCLSLLQRIGYGFSHAFIKFSCVNVGITDIEILSKFQFLRFVFLSHNHISDISPIFAAEYLMYLKADYNRIVKAGITKGLPYLQYFDLSHNKLTSTDYINHGRLKHLILNYNEIITLEGVEGPPLNQFKLRSLETLELRGNKIISTDGLCNLEDLKTLYLSENLLTKVGDISQMKGLVRLHLRDNNIRRLDGFLLGLPNLKYLNLRGNQIRRWLEPKNLISISSLETLILSDNPIADRDHYRPVVLGMLPHLQRLDKDKTSPKEIEDSVAFYSKLDERFFDEPDEVNEEEVEVGKEAEQLPEAKMDEMMEGGGIDAGANEPIVEEEDDGGDEESEND